MFYPNRAQWWVIWITTVIGLVFWINAAPYDSPSMYDRMTFAIFAVGACWSDELREDPET